MSKLKSFLSGEILAKEGDHSKNFFVLVEGRVGIFKGDKQLAEFNKEGTIIGELSMILKRPRTATIRSLSPGSVLIFEGELEDIIKLYPDYSKKLINSLAERLANTDELFLT